MNRKQQERANAKYAVGLDKRLKKAELSDWEVILDEALHHIAKNNKSNDKERK